MPTRARPRAKETDGFPFEREAGRLLGAPCYRQRIVDGGDCGTRKAKELRSGINVLSGDERGELHLGVITSPPSQWTEFNS